MIVKIKSHKSASFGKVLRYMLDSKDRLFDKNQRTFCITHNLKGNSIAKWEEQYLKNESYRLRKRKDNVILTHEILSWHRDDSKNITLSMLEDMTREYLLLRNPKGMYIAVPHFDKDHYHVHICASGVENKTGKSLRLSKTNLSKLSKGIQEYQIEKYPILSNSIVNRTNKKRVIKSEKEYQIKIREGRATDRETLQIKLKACLGLSFSKEDFLKNLEKFNVRTYFRSGKVTGVIINGRKFRFSRIGIENDIFQELNDYKNRKKELEVLRIVKKKKHKELNL